MAEELDGALEAWRVEAVLGAGIDDQPDRNALAALPRYSPVVAALHHVAALLRQRPVVAFADQDQGGNGHVAFRSQAFWIERDGGAEFVLGILLDGAVLDRGEREPAALRKSEHRDPGGIDERLPHQEIQGPVGVEREIYGRAAVAGVLDAARPETVDGERHIAPGRDRLAPAFIQPPPVAIARM